MRVAALEGEEWLKPHGGSGKILIRGIFAIFAQWKSLLIRTNSLKITKNNECAHHAFGFPSPLRTRDGEPVPRAK